MPIPLINRIRTNCYPYKPAEIKPAALNPQTLFTQIACWRGSKSRDSFSFSYAYSISL